MPPLPISWLLMEVIGKTGHIGRSEISFLQSRYHWSSEKSRKQQHKNTQWQPTSTTAVPQRLCPLPPWVGQRCPQPLLVVLFVGCKTTHDSVCLLVSEQLTERERNTGGGLFLHRCILSKFDCGSLVVFSAVSPTANDVQELRKLVASNEVKGHAIPLLWLINVFTTFC